MHALRSITLHYPERIAFGANGATDALVAYARATRCRRVFVVTSPSVMPHAAALVSTLKGLGVLVRITMGVPPEPTVTVCEHLRGEAAAFGPDVVLGVGGGSVLDVAKLVAALHPQSHPVSDFFGLGLLSERRTGLICIPTTSGTGSEVSPNALLYDEGSSSKKAVISPALVPDLAIVDPALTVGLPPALTATTGIDALAHCLEEYANLAAHPVVDLYALEGVRLIASHLVRAVTHGSDLDARCAVALGSLYGGLGLGPVNTAGVHALAYPLGGEFRLAHGLSIALLLPHVVRYNAPDLATRYAALARALGADPGTPELQAAAECADRLDALIAACGIRRGLSAHGIPRDALHRLADAAMGVTRLLKNNPRAISRDDARRIYEAAF